VLEVEVEEWYSTILYLLLCWAGHIEGRNLLEEKECYTTQKIINK
jgi:hypothetical protein